MMKNQRMKAKHMVRLELNKLERLELAHFGNLLKLKPTDFTKETPTPIR
jgi:hypothetical protein